MFAEEYLNLQLIRLDSPEAWVNPGRGIAFLFPQAGSGRCALRNRDVELTAGDILIVNAGLDGAQVLPGPGGLAFWKFSACLEHLFPLFAAQEICLLQVVIEGLKELRHYPHSTRLARDCHSMLAGVPPQLNLEHRSQLLRVAAAVFSTEFQNARQQRLGSARPEERIVQVFEQLTMTEIFSLSVEDLASRFGCSRRHLNRLFHQHLGVSISALRMEMRLLKAVSLLRNPGCKVINVAEECGFNHLGLFNTCFKKRFGVTPGQWRNVERGGLKTNGSHDGSALCPLRTNGLCPWTGPVKEPATTGAAPRPADLNCSPFSSSHCSGPIAPFNAKPPVANARQAV